MMNVNESGSIAMADSRLICVPRMTKSDIRIDDIARALSNICRWTGHLDDFYSVAQHSCHVSDLLTWWSRKVALEGLLHDAAEAYVSDMASPIKRLEDLGGYRRLECVADAAVRDAFGLPALEHDMVKEADAVMVKFEADQFFNNPSWASDWHDAPTRRWRIEPWSPMRARTEFLTRFKELTCST